MPKGSIDRAFAVSMFTEHRDQASICSFALRVVSVRTELALGHLRYYFRDVPPQSNSPPGSVPDLDRAFTMLPSLQPTHGTHIAACTARRCTNVTTVRDAWNKNLVRYRRWPAPATE